MTAEWIRYLMRWMLTATCSLPSWNLNQTRRNELLSLVLLYKALGGGWQQ